MFSVRALSIFLRSPLLHLPNRGDVELAGLCFILVSMLKELEPTVLPRSACACYASKCMGYAYCGEEATMLYRLVWHSREK